MIYQKAALLASPAGLTWAGTLSSASSTPMQHCAATTPAPAATEYLPSGNRARRRQEGGGGGERAARKAHAKRTQSARHADTSSRSLARSCIFSSSPLEGLGVVLRLAAHPLGAPRPQPQGGLRVALLRRGAVPPARLLDRPLARCPSYLARLQENLNTPRPPQQRQAGRAPSWWRNKRSRVLARGLGLRRRRGREEGFAATAPWPEGRCPRGGSRL